MIIDRKCCVINRVTFCISVFPTEPGYYEDGAFGIRIENVVLVKEAETKYNFAGKKYLTMEPVTMVGLSPVLLVNDVFNNMHTFVCVFIQAPIQNKMIEPSMLTAEEVRGNYASCMHRSE